MEMLRQLFLPSSHHVTTWMIFERVAVLLFLCQDLDQCVALTQIRVGVMQIDDVYAPYSVQRSGPAIDIAIQTVNTQMLNSSYQLVTVKRVYDSVCDSRFSSGVAAELFYTEHIHAMVGPACNTALDSVAKLAAFWNIPIITGVGDGGLLNNKTTYPTLTRFSYCQCRLRRVFASVFQEFQWRDIALVFDMNDVSAKTLGETLSHGLQESKYFPTVYQFYSQENPNIDSTLQEASLRSRIILLVMSGDLIRQFLLKAYDLGYPQSGDYVFMNVVLFHFAGPYWGNNDWLRGDARDQDARIAYDSLLTISLHTPQGDDWLNFTVDCMERSQRDYNFTYKDEEVNFFVGAFHDAVLRYGRAVNETISLGLNITDGSAVTRRMWNYTTHGVTGDVIIDSQGNRDTNFAINDMDPVTGKFQTVANYWGASPGYSPVDGKTIHWAGNRLQPPPNKPPCGFSNQDAKCRESDNVPAYLAASISILALCVIAVAVGLLVYRRYMWEISLNSLVSYDDIKFRADVGHSSKLRVYSLLSVAGQYTHKSMDDNPSMASETEQNYARVAVYQGEIVTLKQVGLYKMDINRNVLLELKRVREMHHENITRFVGACLEPGKIYLLYEYCKKGSLQDVLQTDTLKLDWSFKMSLLRDIVKGMIYVHHSELGVHGRLTSANCVVDGKFNVKVTDFGLPSFCRESEGDDSENRHCELQKLLWTAPEHILNFRRHGGSKKGDVYSFSIIMEETITRSVPFDSHRTFLEVEEIISRVCANENPPFRPEVLLDCESRECYKKLMERCWSEDPDERPTFDMIHKVINTITGGKEVAFVDRLLARLEEYTSNLEDLVEERTQQLALEKKKSEMLLDEILPRSVSEKLKQGQPVDPESYDMATIYFSDIVGFTSLSAMSTPMEVVKLLNALYSRFDATIENFDVYKIETIGDAYMVASGLPLRNGNNHVLHISRLALQLLLVVASFEVPHKPEHKLQLRIGLHSGPVVTGVVGLKMPRYCLFGDTVNTASRMESNGQAQKIHISQSTKELLDEVGHFETELRGDIAIKGKGVQTTYWLLGEQGTDDNKSILAVQASPKPTESQQNHDKVKYSTPTPCKVQHLEQHLLDAHNNKINMPPSSAIIGAGSFNLAYDWSTDNTSKVITP